MRRFRCNAPPRRPACWAPRIPSHHQDPCACAHRLGTLCKRLQREADVLEGLVLRGAAQHVGGGGYGKQGQRRRGAQALAGQGQRGGRHGHRHQPIDEDDEEGVAEALARARRPKAQRHQPLLDQRVDLRAGRARREGVSERRGAVPGATARGLSAAAAAGGPGRGAARPHSRLTRKHPVMAQNSATSRQECWRCVCSSAIAP